MTFRPPFTSPKRFVAITSPIICRKIRWWTEGFFTIKRLRCSRKKQWGYQYQNRDSTRKYVALNFNNFMILIFGPRWENLIKDGGYNIRHKWGGESTWQDMAFSGAFLPLSWATEILQPYEIPWFNAKYIDWRLVEIFFFASQLWNVTPCFHPWKYRLNL